LAGTQLTKKFTGKGWTEAQQTLIAEALAAWLGMPLLDNADVCLGQLGVKTCRAEMEFMMSANRVNAQAIDALVSSAVLAGHARPPLLPNQINGMLKGFIDLVFVHDEKYYVVDYKF